MVDSSWDNSGIPAAKRGMSLWAKIGLGCGVVVLLLALTCGGCVWYGLRKGSEALDAQWTTVHSTVVSLGSETGARALYASNPGLKDSYPTEGEFLAAASEWRPNLGTVPAQRPDFRTLFKDHKLEARGETTPGHRVWHLRYTLDSGKRLVLETENGKLVELRVE